MIDNNLWEEYLKTTYEVYVNEKVIKLRVNRYNPEIDELLEKSGSKSWVFITAFNPYSEKLSDTENKILMKQLLKDLSEQKYLTFPGAGKPDNNEWSPEISVLVLDIPENKINYLVAKYEQNAVVTGIKGKSPTLKLFNTLSY